MQEPNSHPVESTPGRRGTLAAVVIVLVMLTSYNGVTPVFATRLCEYFELSVEQYGTTIGLGSVGEISALLLAGLLIARFGVRRISEISLIGIGGCFVYLGLGASLLSLQCSIIFQGFFAGIAKVAIPAFLIALFPIYKRRMISIRYVAASLTGIAIPFWAVQLLKWSTESGDRDFANLFFGPFLIIGCVLVLVGLLLNRINQPALQIQQETQQGLRLLDLLEYRSLMIVLLVALHVSADSALYQFMPLWMEHHFDELPFSPAWALAGHNFAYLVTRFLLSLLPERFGQRKILVLAGPVGGLIILSMLWQGHAGGIPLLYTLASLFYAAEFPVLISEISSRSMGQFGTVLGAGFLAGSVANFVFLKGTGKLVDSTGDYRVGLSVAACGFIAFGLVAAVSGLGKKSSHNVMDA